MKHYLTALGLLITSVAYCQTDPGYEAYKQSPAYKKSKAKFDSLQAVINQPLSKEDYKEPKDAGLIKLDEKYGFRDVKFEMLPSQIKGLAPILSRPIHGKQIYTRPTDSKKIGSYSVYEITYAFFKDKLSSITLKSDGLNSKGVREAFQALYGEPAQSNPYLEDYAWLGDKVSIMYSEKISSNDATIILWSNKMQDFEEQENEKDAKKASSDL